MINSICCSECFQITAVSPEILIVEFVRCFNACGKYLNAPVDRQEGYEVESSTEHPAERKNIKRNVGFNFCLY